MYKLAAFDLGLKDHQIAYGETKEEVIGKMLTYLQVHHPEFIGEPSLQRLAELDSLMHQHIAEI